MFSPDHPSTRRICAWCGKTLGKSEGSGRCDGFTVEHLTHGICESCTTIFFSEVLNPKELERLNNSPTVKEVNHRRGF